MITIYPKHIDKIYISVLNYHSRGKILGYSNFFGTDQTSLRISSVQHIVMRP